MKIKIIFLFAVLLCLSCGQPQTEIKGELFIKTADGQTKRLSALTVKFIKKEKFESLKNSEITIADADYFTTTDADGKFSVKVPNGEYVAVADYTENDIPFIWRVPFIASGGEKQIPMR